MIVFFSVAQQLPDTLPLAKVLGATHTINRNEVSDITTSIKKLADKYVKYAIDISGYAPYIQAAIQSTCFQGKIIVLSPNGNMAVDFFSREIKAEDILKFKELWSDSCRKRGIASGYFSVDGSNIDCESKGVEITEKGKAKSGNNVNIINFMYAVSESDGTPITYMVYRGSVVDSKALDGISEYLKAYKIRAKGFVLDRGFCYQACTDHLRNLKTEYVLMLKNNVQAFKTTADASGNGLKFNVQNRIPGAEIFGVTGEDQLFLESKEKESLHLYYDWRNGGERAFAFMGRVDQVIAEAGQALSEKKTAVYPG